MSKLGLTFVFPRDQVGWESVLGNARERSVVPVHSLSPAVVSPAFKFHPSQTDRPCAAPRGVVSLSVTLPPPIA